MHVRRGELYVVDVVTTISDILGYSLGVAITGTEDTTTLIITEGFGRIGMAERTYALLSSNEGKFASINGSTQIRAGVIRPEVIIPHSFDNELQNFCEEDMIISEGSVVRVIRTPFFGLVGTVVELPSDLSKLESETEVRIAKVKFKNGNIEIIPRANLEMILS